MKVKKTLPEKECRNDPVKVMADFAQAKRHGQTIVPPAAPQGEQPDEDGILRTGSADR